MRAAPPPRHLSGRKKRAVTWFEICVILALAGSMAALAWAGRQRELAEAAQKKAVPAAKP